MDTTILEDIGFTNAEIKIYIALLELGTAKAGAVIKKTGLQNSVVHLTLQKLSGKGFLSYVKKGGVKEYTAADPENILKLIEDRKNRFKQILPDLLAKRKKVEKQDVEIYQGFKGLKNMLLEFIKDAKKGDEYLFFVFDTNNPEDYEHVYNFYQREFYEERIKKGIFNKGLAPVKLKSRVTRVKWTRKAVKFVGFPIPTNIAIFRNKIAFTPWEDGQTSFLVYSRQLADSLRKYFHSVWDNVK